MEKLKWIGIILAVGIVLNLLLLDFQFFELRERQRGISGRLRELSQIEVGEKEDERLSSLAPAPANQKILSLDACPQSCLEKIGKLEEAVAKITPQVIKEVEKTETVVSQTSTAKEFSVPFGSGKTNSQDWEDIPGLNAYIDANNYKNIKSVKFEASLRIPTANGTVYARLYNETDKHPVWNSEVSSEGPTATLKQSGNINLDSGNKLYKVQMKTSMKFESLLDSARVKIIVE